MASREMLGASGPLQTADTTRPLILVVDDRPRSRRQIVTRLEARGFETLEAADGISGWAQFQSYRPVAVVTDMQMPGGSGADGMSLLRLVRESSSTPVFCITAYPSWEDGLLSVKRGAEYYYRWPLELDQLIDDLVRKVSQMPWSPSVRSDAKNSLEEIRRSGREKQAETRRALVTAALRETGGNVGQAADRLQISRRTLYHWMERYGVERPPKRER